MNVILVRSAVILLAATALTPAVAAKTIKVPKQQPTLQAAVNAASSGDTIVVTGGVHVGPIAIPSTKKGLRIEGNKKVWVETNPTFPEAGPAFRVQADDVTLEDIGIRHGGANSADPDAGGVSVFADGVVLKKLRLERGKGPAIRVAGDGAHIDHCEIRGFREGIVLVGDGSIVKDCDVRMIEQNGIFADGKGTRIRDCHIERIRKVGIRAQGSGATIRGNDVVAAAQGGIYVQGAAVSVVDNEVRMTGGAAPSIEVKLDTGHGTTKVSEIRDNRCLDGDGAGIRMSGEGLGLIDGNRVVGCGSSSAFGIAVTPAAGIESFGKDVVDNKVEDCAGDGIRVAGYSSGFSTLVTDNRVTGNLEDGIEITGGKFVEVRDNVLRSNLGEGFENGGDQTLFVGNVAKKNRIDVASTGTFGVYKKNSYGSGGPDQKPEVK